MRYETCCLHNVTLYSLLNEYAVVMTVFSMALARFPTGIHKSSYGALQSLTNRNRCGANTTNPGVTRRLTAHLNPLKA